MTRLLFLLLGLFVAQVLSAQTTSGTRPFARADSLAARIPQEETKTVATLAAWIGRQGQSDTEKLRILFAWIANNIAYDVQEKFAASNYYHDSIISTRALSLRKGVCMHYATLFCETATLMGIRAELVTGQTMQKSIPSPTGHVWVAAMLEGKWHLLDPTWAAGSVDGMRFIKRFSPKWFMTPPDTMVLSHLPIDPQWQLLERPVSLTRFATGKDVAGIDQKHFAFNDSILQYFRMDEAQQALTTVRRLKESFRFDSTWPGDGDAKKPRLEEYNLHLLPILNNQAADHYNSAIAGINRYIAHKNKQFSPAIPEARLRGSLNSASSALDSAQVLLNAMSDARNRLATDIKKKQALIAEAKSFVKEEQAFVDLFYNTPASGRKKLFYK
jgi:transglutaminase/protease-like cytokinesis protein 3